MKKLIVIYVFFLVLKINAQTHRKFTEILSKYSKDGMVDYAGLKGDKKFPEYLDMLESTNIELLNYNERLAFWINAYNAFTIKIVIDNYPIESITDLHTGGKVIGFLLGKTVWDKEFIVISGKEYSLNFIEHEILRKMNEPRIHFAIVCASISCPELRNEAYAAGKLERQFDEQTGKFLNDITKNKFDIEKREAEISNIFDWFDEDFGDDDEQILKYISKYLPDTFATNIKENISDWDISYMDYNWGLNDLKKK